MDNTYYLCICIRCKKYCVVDDNVYEMDGSPICEECGKRFEVLHKLFFYEYAECAGYFCDLGSKREFKNVDEAMNYLIGWHDGRLSLLENLVDQLEITKKAET